MSENTPQYQTIDEYLTLFPPEVQEILRTIRTVIHEAAPEAEEKISYRMPTFYLYGNLVHFAAFKHHIGFFPSPGGLEAFKDELAGYTSSKGGVQFPLDKPIPYELIAKITRFRVEENLRCAKERALKKKQ